LATQRGAKFGSFPSSPRYVVAIAAGKGGVGKSTTAVNLAHALHRSGFSVGVLDADIYGPSLGRMMPVEVFPSIEEEEIIPGKCQGISVFSVAYMHPEEKSMSVRAPVVNGWIQKCVEKISWGELDYLLVDFPPGTGDIQLTLVQEIPFAGALLVTTPQSVSTSDVKKAAHMFHQMEVPILGVVENMSYLGDTYPFGKGGGKSLADFLQVPLLCQIPLDERICSCSDTGKNICALYPDSLPATIWQMLSDTTRNILFEQEQVLAGSLQQFTLLWKEM
jgi:ATP-binding protein involved in chromosome partitioning